MSSITLTSTSDSEEDSMTVPRRIIRDRNDLFEVLDDINFKARFRFSKGTVMELLNNFGAQIEPLTLRNKSLNSRQQLLIALRFYATGTFQQVLGDHVNVHKSTVCRVVRRVTRIIASMKPQHIKLPVGNELHNTKRKFFAIRGFPRVLGAIDCTHVRIQSPGGPEAERFRNRKGYFSINVQVVCDADLKILNIIARWPGSVHDSTIFNDSPLCAELEARRYGNSYLLGDNGYPCRPYLLTPLLHPRTAAQRAYNVAHIATRNTIERCFGMLKRRFPCLSLGLRNALPTVLHIIVACAVLHNIALDLGDEVCGDDYPQEDPEIENVNLNELTTVRDEVIQTIFTI